MNTVLTYNMMNNMSIRILKTLLSTTLAVLLFARPAFAQSNLSDIYQYLSNLHVPQSIEKAELLSHGGTLYSSTDERSVYTFPSTKNTNPHILYLDKTNSISYLQITIPTSDQNHYKDLLADFSDPETILRKTKSEILYSYPSRGLSIIINGYTGLPDRVMYYPPKTVEQHLQQEAVNYVPSPAPTQSQQGLLDRLDLSKTYRYLSWFALLLGSITIWFVFRKMSRRS